MQERQLRKKLERDTLTVHYMRDGRAACARTRAASESYASMYLRPGESKRNLLSSGTSPRRAFFTKQPSDPDQVEPPEERKCNLLPPVARPRRASAPQTCKHPDDSDQLKPPGECKRNLLPSGTRPRRAFFTKQPSDPDQIEPPEERRCNLLPPVARPRRASAP